MDGCSKADHPCSYVGTLPFSPLLSRRSCVTTGARSQQIAAQLFVLLLERSKKRLISMQGRDGCLKTSNRRAGAGNLSLCNSRDRVRKKRIALGNIDKALTGSLALSGISISRCSHPLEIGRGRG
jgi:hypothetical protein